MDPRYKSPTAAVIEFDADAFRDLTTFTTVLAWMLRAGAALAFLSTVLFGMQLELLSRSFSAEEGAANAQRVIAIAGATMLLRLVTFFVFGRWKLDRFALFNGHHRWYRSRTTACHDG